MKVFISPTFGKESGQGGIKRVVEAQLKYLPQLGVEIVDDPEDADLVNCHAVELVKHPVMVHGCHGLYWSDFQWGNWAHTANLRILEMMKQAQVVTVPSEWVANAVRRGTLIDPMVCLHGIEPEEWEVKPSQGYVFWGKNRPDAVCDPTVVNKLAMMSPEIPYVSTFGVESSNVRLIGQRSFSEIKPVLQSAGVYLGTVLETGGITLLESMASGVPILGWNFGANAELVIHKETGYLAEPGNYSDLLEGLYYCLKERERLGAAARDHVLRNFTWRQRIEPYVVAYERALKQVHATAPEVSVIVTAYNLEEYLPACLDSVLSQEGVDWELVIVEDSSPDNCGEIADNFKAAHPDHNIKVIHNQTNQYLAESRNIGIRASSGKYIMPLDADDMLAPNALKLLSRSLRKGSSLDIVTGAMELIEPDGRHWVSDWPSQKPNYEHQIMTHNQVPYASMYRRWVWERTGGYRRRMITAEDAEFWSRAMSYGARSAKVTDAPTLIYNNRPASMSHSIPTPNWNAWLTWSVLPHIAPSGGDATGEGVHNYGPIEISVVIPCGPGHGIYLQDALDSLVAQTFLEWEAIVVNDTGGDISEYVRGFPFVRVIEPPFPLQNVAKARNLGIEVARSPLIFLLDADDWLQPLAIEAYHEAWKKYGGFIYSDWRDEFGEEKQAQNWNSDLLMEKMLGPVTGLYAKADIKLAGGFDPNMLWEDWSLHLSLLDNEICGSRIAQPLWTYRYGGGKRREEVFAKAEIALKQILEKHKRLYQDCGR